MESRVSSQLFLPTCVAFCLGLMLFCWSPTPGDGAGRIGTDPLATQRELQRLWLEEFERYQAERRKRAPRLQEMEERLRLGQDELERARVERRKAEERSAQLQAEIEALRKALRK